MTVLTTHAKYTVSQFSYLALNNANLIFEVSEMFFLAEYRRLYFNMRFYIFSNLLKRKKKWKKLDVYKGITQSYLTQNQRVSTSPLNTQL